MQVFQEILTFKLRKSSFGPQKLGVDFNTGKNKCTTDNI